MALPPTLYDFDVSLSHVDAGLERRLSIKVARHPSETLERLWLRVFAFCWKWEEGITFGPGICDPDAPDVLVRDLTGDDSLWIRVGKPDPMRLQREVDQHPRARFAVLFDSPRRMADFFQEALENKRSRLGRVEFAALDAELLAALAAVDERRNRITLTIVEDHLYVDRGGHSFDGALHRFSAPSE